MKDPVKTLAKGISRSNLDANMDTTYNENSNKDSAQKESSDGSRQNVAR